MKLQFLVVMAAALIPVPATAAHHIRISSRNMLAAIKAADPAQLDGVSAANITVLSVRVTRCVGPAEEPTEDADPFEWS
jgi:hypothetical protein